MNGISTRSRTVIVIIAKVTHYILLFPPYTVRRLARVITIFAYRLASAELPLFVYQI